MLASSSLLQACGRTCRGPPAFAAAPPASGKARRQHRAQRLLCRAALDGPTTLAVTQQGIAFGGWHDRTFALERRSLQAHLTPTQT